MLFVHQITPFRLLVALIITGLIIGGLALFFIYQDNREKSAITAEDVFTALSQGDMTRIGFCLKAKPELVNARDKDGYSPLHIAAKRNMADTARLLLKMGGDPTLKDPSGKTTEDIAKENGSNDVSEVLREKTGGSGSGG